MSIPEFLSHFGTEAQCAEALKCSRWPQGFRCPKCSSTHTGAPGDAMHAVLCGAGHSLRMILPHLRVLHCAFIGQLVQAMYLVTRALRPSLPLPARRNGLFGPTT
jgi:hypothetical protein